MAIFKIKSGWLARSEDKDGLCLILVTITCGRQVQSWSRVGSFLLRTELLMMAGEASVTTLGHVMTNNRKDEEILGENRLWRKQKSLRIENLKMCFLCWRNTQVRSRVDCLINGTENPSAHNLFQWKTSRPFDESATEDTVAAQKLISSCVHARVQQPKKKKKFLLLLFPTNFVNSCCQ